MSTMLPIIQQMHDAPDNRARADLLLRCPDSVILKYAGAFVEACERAGFAGGAEFVLTRRAFLMAVRDGAGMLPEPMARVLEDLRATMVRFVALPDAAIRADAEIAEIRSALDAAVRGADPP